MRSPRQACLPRRLLILALLVLTVSSLARGAVDFEADAAIIAGLSLLLMWVLRAEQVRHEEICRKVDQLLDLQRYGPLSDDDLAIIEALRVGPAGRWPPNRPAP